MNFLRNWPLALFVFYLCLIAPAVLSCEAHLDLTNQPTFKLKGKLGEPVEYTQLVYAGDQMSFSTIIFPTKVLFSKKKVLKSTARGMISTVQNRTKNFTPDIKLLNESLLPQIDPRLTFLSYVQYGVAGSVNIEASGVVKTDKCWALLRFTALAKDTKEEALNRFAGLIRSTTVN